MARSFSTLFDVFLDGFTGAGLTGKLRRPGAPTEFVDSSSVEDFKNDGEYASTVSRFRAAVDQYGGTRVPQVSVMPGVNSGTHRGDGQHLAKYMSGHR